MKKFFFWLFCLLSFLALLRALDIFINDRERLTEFGWGFFTGKVLLFLLLAFIAFLLRTKKPKA